MLFSVLTTEASAGKKAGKVGSSSIQRSVETGMAVEYPRGGSGMNRQASRESTDGSMNSYSSEGKYVNTKGTTGKPAKKTKQNRVLAKQEDFLVSSCVERYSGSSFM